MPWCIVNRNGWMIEYVRLVMCIRSWNQEFWAHSQRQKISSSTPQTPLLLPHYLYAYATVWYYNLIHPPLKRAITPILHFVADSSNYLQMCILMLTWVIQCNTSALADIHVASQIPPTSSTDLFKFSVKTMSDFSQCIHSLKGGFSILQLQKACVPDWALLLWIKDITTSYKLCHNEMIHSRYLCICVQFDCLFMNTMEKQRHYLRKHLRNPLKTALPYESDRYF